MGIVSNGFRVTCDECGTSGPEAPFEYVLISKVRDMGWDIGKTICVCPSCQEKEETK